MDTKKAVIEGVLRTGTAADRDKNWDPAAHIANMHAMGDFCSLAKIEFRSSDSMWCFLKFMKGRRFEYANGAAPCRLWHSIDKSIGERTIGRQTTKAIKEVKDHLVQKGFMDAEVTFENQKKVLTGNFDFGIVRYIRSSDDSVHRLFCKNKDDELWARGDGALTSGLADFDWAESLRRINEA